MKILQLNFERGWRGGERQTLLGMEQFRRAGHQVALLARADGELARRAKAAGFTVYERPHVGGVCQLLLSQGRRFDIVHAQTANMVTWLALFRFWLGRRVVFTRRTAFPVPPARQRCTLWKWERVDVLVAISQAAAAEPRRLGLHAHLIPSAIEAKPLDLDRTRAFSEQFNPSGKRMLATAASLTVDKDPCTLVRAVH